MIIDIHTHFMSAQEEFGPLLRADMRRCGIAEWPVSEAAYLEAVRPADMAVVFGLKAKMTGWHISNERVAEFAARRPDKFIYFASIDPYEYGFMDDLEFNHKELQCRGVKLGPIYQGVHPQDERYGQIYEYCELHRLPVMIHMATTFSSGVPLDYARPIHMDAVACGFPQLRIILAHMGHPWEPEAIAVIRRNENVFADLSALYYRPWQFYNSMRLAIEYGCCDKILFGSDYPATTTGASLDGVRGITALAEKAGLPPVPPDVIDKIIFCNTQKFLEDSGVL